MDTFLKNKTYSLEKNDIILQNKGQSKIIEIIDEDDDENKKFKLDTNGKKETIPYSNLEISVAKSLKLVIVTVENKIFELSYPVDINCTFESFYFQFCDDYLVNEKQVAIVFKNNKLSKKEKRKIKIYKRL